MQKKKILFVLISLIAFAGGYTLLANRNNTVPAASTSKKSAVPTGSVKPVEIELPGAKPIPAIQEDYDNPDSLWVLVNKDHPLADERYVPKSIIRPDVAVRQDKSLEEQSVRADIAEPTKRLFDAAKLAGFDLMLASGYRSYELQQTYFTSYSRSYGEEAAGKFSARPGQSEHQTGLTFDISYVSRECYLDVCFGKTEAGKWLATNAHTYGFILRYPEEKVAITRYQYEPWHFRYVGINLAAALHDSGLTMEEAYPHIQEALKELKRRGDIE